MRWLSMRRYRSAGQRGAMSLLVAILVSGILLTLGVFVTDVGSWYAERAQLQNGADAAALAVAQTCIAGNCDTGMGAGDTAGRYANANANDNLATVDRICGNGPGLEPCGSIPTCPSGVGNHVTVRTITLEDGGSHLLPPMMGELALGNSYDGRTIAACATVSWVNAGSGLGFALTVSLCAWQKATANGTVFGPQPPFASWPPSGVPGYVGNPPAPGLAGGEQALLFHGSGNDCVGNPSSGWQLPGGFGYLLETGTPPSCTTEITTANTYSASPGNSISGVCSDRLAQARDNHTLIYLPVYDGVQGSGANGVYHLAGFGAFLVTGGYLNGQGGGFKEASTLTGMNYCRGSQRCLYGFFTQGLVPQSGRGTAGSLPGAYTLVIIG